MNGLEELLAAHYPAGYRCGDACDHNLNSPDGWADHVGELVRGLTDAAIRQARADAWDKGHRTRQRRGPDDCQCAAYSEGECGCGRYGTGPLISLADNPYREATR